MAGARHLRGTMYTRVSNLLRSGAIKQKPVWFDVVEAFPPIVATKINRKPEAGRVDKLEYPEDFFRRKFYNTFQSYGLLNLKEGQRYPITDCERFVKKCQDFVNQGKDEEEAFDNASQYFTTEVPTSEKLHTEASESLPDDLDSLTSLDDFLKPRAKTQRHKDK